MYENKTISRTYNNQQAYTGTKMIHLGKNTRSTIISKGIAAGRSSNAYRGLVRMNPGAEGARNFTECDSLLIGDLRSEERRVGKECRVRWAGEQYRTDGRR